MRLQILELPARRLGPAEETPFVIVISEAPRGWAREGMDFTALKEGTGAQHVVCVEEVVDIGPRPEPKIRVTNHFEPTGELHFDAPPKLPTGPDALVGFRTAGPPRGR